MGNHRADRRGHSRRPSETPTAASKPGGGRRKATKSSARSAAAPKPAPLSSEATKPSPSVPTPTRTMPVAPSAPAAPDTARRAAAAKPAPRRAAARTATAAKPAKPAERSVEKTRPVATEPVPTKPAATKPAARRSSPPKAAARRAAPRRAASRGPLFKGLPSTPVLLGVAALAVSAGGAVTAAPSLMGSDEARVQPASALTGASSVSQVNLLERTASVSRDSSRDALGDAANDKLVAAAEQQAQQHNAALARLARQAEDQAHKIALNQWQLPVDGYHLTARFGECSTLWASCHTGLDFAAPSGTPIHAVAGGTVTYVGYDGSYGNKTVITLDDGTELWFCHQTSYTVSVGETVEAGELIGSIGSTGNVTGPHLHLEVRPGGGDPVDPYEALVVHGLQP